MSGEVLALVNYYARAGYYRHLQTVCNEVLKKRGSTDPTLVFWRALGMLKEGAVNDAIRDYEGIKSRGDLQLALPSKLALVHAHQMSKVVDGEEVHVRDMSGDRTLVRFGTGDEVTVTAGEHGVRFLLVSGAPIREPVAWHGPIVMNTRQELIQAVNDLQNGTFIREGARF